MAGGVGDERCELEAASWAPEERGDKTVWRNPINGIWYAQGQAIAMLRERADPDVPLEPEGGA